MTDHLKEKVVILKKSLDESDAKIERIREYQKNVRKKIKKIEKIIARG